MGFSKKVAKIAQSLNEDGTPMVKEMYLRRQAGNSIPVQVLEAIFYNGIK
jgi:site-specific DNA-cytosine methylase